MKSFISETLDDILKTTTEFSDVIFVTPSQRSTIFLKKKLIDKASNGFLPELLSIEQFIENLSGVFKIDTITLLFEFYSVYLEKEKTPDSFDVFCSWAPTVLQDFNDIDQYLVDSKDIFFAIRDIRRLQEWSVDTPFKETKLVKDHYRFLKQLYDFYPNLYKRLKEKKLGYQGLIYKEAYQNLEKFISENSEKKIFFLGFNALNKVEENIFRKLLNEGIAEVYWDIDNLFYQNNHQAGQFIRRYKNTWKFYEKNKLKIVSNQFSSLKKIDVVGAPKNITQVKFAAELLSRIDDLENTALVLADETLLTPMLNSLPENVNTINITMGFPLKEVPATNCILNIFKLFSVQKKLNKTTSKEFYYKEIVEFLKDSLLSQFFLEKDRKIIDEFLNNIVKQNLLFVSLSQLQDTFKKCTKDVEQLLIAVFKVDDVDSFIAVVLSFLLKLKDNVSALDKEYLYRYFTIFTQLKNLHENFGFFTDIKNLEQFFKQLAGIETLSFKGEPLQGLQLMGMLETRVIDFKNVILIGANEGILPNNKSQNSFIPFDVKLNFGLPTYKEKDAIFSYHFFRLLQRAENVTILYNTEPDAYGSGEKSRFIKQLELIKKNVSSSFVSPTVIPDKRELLTIPKTKNIIEIAEKLAKKGLSPSSLTLYLHNPVAFYKQKILKIKEADKVEETIAFNTLGTVVHDVLDEMYKPFVNKYIEVENVKRMKENSKSIVEKFFKKHFKNGVITTGKNRLIFEVANQFVLNFLNNEESILLNKVNRLKIIATEETLSTTLDIDGFNFPVKLHGQVDRVDELNGVLRIIDYKTGKVDASNLKIVDFDLLREEKHHKAIQVLLYAYLYMSNNPNKDKCKFQAGIYSFKNLKKGFLPINFSNKSNELDLDITNERLEEFLIQLKLYISEIYDSNKNFEEPKGVMY